MHRLGFSTEIFGNPLSSPNNNLLALTDFAAAPDGRFPAGAGVHWHEGQFLQPHHFQALQRHAADLVGVERTWTLAYPYGLASFEVSPDALANWRVDVRRLRAVMPDGRLVDVPGTAELPPLDLRGRFDPNGEPLTLYLAVPTYHADRANATGAVPINEEAYDDLDADLGDADDYEAPQATAMVGDRRAWIVRPSRVADENTGDNQQSILVRRLNARLITEGEDAAGLETLPIMRITAGAGGVPMEDNGFIPPCLTITGCERLREQFEDLADLVEASRKKLIRQMTRESFSFETIRGAQFEQQVRLRTLNRAAVRLRAMSRLPNVPPIAAYLELRELLAEMSARFPERDAELSAVPDYRHDDPAIAFATLEELLRPLLGEETRETFRKHDFRPDPEGGLIVRLNGRDISEPDGYYLGVTQPTGSGAMTDEQLRDFIIDARGFKVMSGRYRHERIYGVRLEEERRPPVALPPEGPQLRYFRLKIDDEQGRPTRMWQEIRREKLVAIKYPDMDRLRLDVSLFMTLSDAAAPTARGADQPPPRSGGGGGGGGGGAEAPRSASRAPERAPERSPDRPTMRPPATPPSTRPSPPPPRPVDPGEDPLGDVVKFD